MVLISEYREMIMEKLEDKYARDEKGKIIKDKETGESKVLSKGERFYLMKDEFLRIARNESDCSSGPARSGEVIFRRGKMHKSFEEAAFALEIGSVSQVVESPSGYHLIYRKE